MSPYLKSLWIQNVYRVHITQLFKQAHGRKVVQCAPAGKQTHGQSQNKIDLDKSSLRKAFRIDKE